MARQAETIIEWQAPEFRHYQKNAAWFITFAIIVIMIVTYQLFQNDWFGAITVLIMAIIFGTFALHKPKDVIITLSTEGIHINDAYIPYIRIKQFWIVNNENHKTLNLETTAYINHLLSIELGNQNPTEVQEILAELLPENIDVEETLAQRIAHKFKF